MVTEVGESNELTFEWACNGEMYLGKLELQTVLVSQKAFDNLTFKNAESVDKLICYPKKTGGLTALFISRFWRGNAAFLSPASGGETPLT